jgi:hypothetical protein
VLIFAVSCRDLTINADPALNGDAWQRLGRSSKFNTIWSLIARDRTPGPWPNTLQLAELFVESMTLSFNASQDDFPKQYIGKLFTRSKLVHSVGAVVAVRYVPVSNPFNYSGIFRSGCDSAIARFSAAATPGTNPDNLTPGIAVKFLRDGVQSGNAFAMYSLLGQPSYNFFKHDLSNHPPDLGDWAPLALKAIKARFSTGSSWPSFLGLSDLARYDQFGRFEPQPSFPYRIVFHPNNRIHTSLPDPYQGIPFQSQVVKVISASNETIYSVFAQDFPGATLVKIGDLITTSPATTAKFGDVSLFFQHTQFESDLRLKPQWAAPADAERTKQRNAQGFQYVDLAWN